MMKGWLSIDPSWTQRASNGRGSTIARAEKYSRSSQATNLSHSAIWLSAACKIAQAFSSLTSFSEFSRIGSRVLVFCVELLIFGSSMSIHSPSCRLLQLHIALLGWYGEQAIPRCGSSNCRTKNSFIITSFSRQIRATCALFPLSHSRASCAFTTS